MAKPPAGSSLLFGALADSGRIKQRKNGSYRMVLKGVDEIDWFTDRPSREAGMWTTKKFVNQWESTFSRIEPNTQATFELNLGIPSDEEKSQQLITFEMYKPKLRKKNNSLSFRVKGIGEKNKDFTTGMINKQLGKVSLFIDNGGLDGNNVPYCDGYGLDCSGYDLAGSNFSYTNLSEYDFTNANLKKANFTSALLTDTNFTGANLTRADFRGAYIDHTIFTDANLTGVKGRAVIDNYIRVYGVADIIMELNPSLTSAEAEKRAMKIDILGLFHEYMESDLEAADGAQLPDLVINSVVISEIIYAPPLN